MIRQQSLTFNGEAVEDGQSLDVGAPYGVIRYFDVAAYPATARQDFLWRTSNSRVVAVAQNGAYLGQRAGTAVVTATAKDDPSKTISFNVTVYLPTAGLLISPTSTVMSLDAQQKIA